MRPSVRHRSLHWKIIPGGANTVEYFILIQAFAPPLLDPNTMIPGTLPMGCHDRLFLFGKSLTEVRKLIIQL